MNYDYFMLSGVILIGIALVCGIVRDVLEGVRIHRDKKRVYPTKSVYLPGEWPRMLYKDIKWQDEYSVGGWTRTPATIKDAEVVSSEVAGGLHCPVLDLDVPHKLIPSSTEGHSHLYIDVPMPWADYKRLLKALARANILEQGYVEASIRRGHTAVRVPWLKKEN